MRSVSAAIGMAGLFTATIVQGTATAAPCDGLTALTVPDVKIVSATAVPAGPFTPPTAARAGASPTPIDLPEFCRVVAVAMPTPDSVINFEVWMPPAAAWNGRFQGVGNGGVYGAVSYAAMTSALKAGYATASTDTGHPGDDMSFGLGHPEKVVDFGYRAIHAMTGAAKPVMRAFYGKLPHHSYFNACSTGGQQAMSEVQRFPADYDGVVAGAPANDRIHLFVAFDWSWIAMHTTPESVIPDAKLPLLTKAAVAACDALDGVKDGIIDDARRCHFDPGVLLCKGAEAEDCLTKPQIEAARKIYAGARNPRTGEQIFPGYAPGSESVGPGSVPGWNTYIVDPKEPMRIGFWRYWIYGDPNLDWHSLDFDHDVAYADVHLPAMYATEANLTPFKARGGKLVMYHGWADPAIPPQASINYYERVTHAMGGPAKTEDFFRLFMAPGMGHCTGGPGPNSFDALGAVVQWVEQGTAPDKLIASHKTGDKVDRTRPLCPYPQVAHWKGSGSTDDAANFTCAAASK